MIKWICQTKTNNDFRISSLFFIGGLVPFFRFPANRMRFGKNADSAIGVESYILSLVFVWRQLELAFFGAVTSVAALFVFREKYKAPLPCITRRKNGKQGRNTSKTV